MTCLAFKHRGQRELFPIIEKQNEKTDINRLSAAAEEDITQMEKKSHFKCTSAQSSHRTTSIPITYNNDSLTYKLFIEGLYLRWQNTTVNFRRMS